MSYRYQWLQYPDRIVAYLADRTSLSIFPANEDDVFTCRVDINSASIDADTDCLHDEFTVRRFENQTDDENWKRVIGLACKWAQNTVRGHYACLRSSVFTAYQYRLTQFANESAARCAEPRVARKHPFDASHPSTPMGLCQILGTVQSGFLALEAELTGLQNRCDAIVVALDALSGDVVKPLRISRNRK